MEKQDKLKRYLRKDYSELVEFPVELVDRDGVVRRYSFEESVEVYQRRIQTAAWRYDDADLIAAEVDHCTKRIEQIERSFLLRRQGGAFRGHEDMHSTVRPDPSVLALLDRAYRGTLARAGYQIRGGADLQVPIVRLEGGEPAEAWRIGFDEDEHHLLYVYRFAGEEGQATRDRFRAWSLAMRCAARLPSADVEHVLYVEEREDLGFALTGRVEMPAALRAQSEPLDDPSEVLPSAESGPAPGEAEGEGEDESPAGLPPTSVAGSGEGSGDSGGAGRDDDEGEDDGPPGAALWEVDLPSWTSIDDESDAPAGTVEFAEGVARLRAGDPSSAIDRFRAAVSANPWSTEIYRVLVTLLDAAGRHEEAGLYARMAERHLPDDAVIALQVGLNLLRQGRHRAALASIDRALRLDPDLHQAHYFAGLVHASRGRLPQATMHLALACGGDDVRHRAEVALEWVGRQRAGLLRLRIGAGALVILGVIGLLLGSAWTLVAAWGVALAAVLSGRPVRAARALAAFRGQLSGGGAAAPEADRLRGG
ncbi:tetratricopeptide repeat protein [Myxococcota bacterium]|nr:tetratricopeptide repeat protein [Myxococcota bacterium]